MAKHPPTARIAIELAPDAALLLSGEASIDPAQSSLAYHGPRVVCLLMAPRPVKQA